MFIYKHANGFKFRKLDKEYLPFLLALKNESWFGTHRVSILNADDQQRWFERLDDNPHSPASLILTGHYEVDCPGIWKLFNIDWQNRKAEAGWDIFKGFRGRKLGKKIVEAGVGFCKNVLNLHRLRSEILDTNEASKKCAIAAGFVLEGVERKAVLKNGGYVDSLIFGIIL